MTLKQDGSRVMDEKDRLILNILQQDAEISLSELGKKVNLTKMAVFNRIRNLKKEGIIEGSYYKVNGDKVGQDYIIITRITCLPKGPEQLKIASAIAKIPGVMSVYLVFGSFDVLVIARRKDKTEAKELVYEISKIQGVRNTVTIVPHTVVKESLVIDTMSH
jgi:Lrp/AsnC family transcriptional regulator, leucine-responsive regulatory protein